MVARTQFGRRRRTILFAAVFRDEGGECCLAVQQLLEGAHLGHLSVDEHDDEVCAREAHHAVRHEDASLLTQTWGRQRYVYRNPRRACDARASRRSRIFLRGGAFCVKDGADCNYWAVGPTAHIG